MLTRLTLKINQILISIKLFLATLHTQKWILKTYGKMCELDLQEFEPIDDNTVILARGNTVEIVECGHRFVINECESGITTHIQFQKSKQWFEVYRTNKFIGAYKWVMILDRAHRQLKKQKIYQRQQTQNLLNSQNGIM